MRYLPSIRTYEETFYIIPVTGWLCGMVRYKAGQAARKPSTPLFSGSGKDNSHETHSNFYRCRHRFPSFWTRLPVVPSQPAFSLRHHTGSVQPMGRAVFRLGTNRFRGHILACTQGPLWPCASRNTRRCLRRLRYWSRCRDPRTSTWLRQHARVVLGRDLLPTIARFRGLRLSNATSQMSLFG
jgi:hypothetical protein